MIKNYLSNKRKTASRILIAGSFFVWSILSGINCGSSKPLFDGEIDVNGNNGKKQRIVYDNSDWTNKMEIYSPDGKLIKIIEDRDGNNIIGNHEFDEYTVITLGENKRILYTKNFVIDENGRKFEGNDDISKKALEIGKTRLEEATIEYQALKGRIGVELEKRLK